MREVVIERRLTAAAKNMGGICAKWVSPGLDGVPDRIVLLPGSKIGFVELKAPGKELRPLQKKRKSQLESLGFSVFKIDSPEQVKEVLDAIQSS